MTTTAPPADTNLPDGDIPRVLNLGCGEDSREHAHNVDISPAVNPDQVLDLEQTPWSLPSRHFNRILAHHVFEHLDSIPTAELERIIRPGGALVVTYPIGHTRFEDTTHTQHWGWHSAEALAGEREHSHEVSGAWKLVNRENDIRISGSAPLERAYIGYRKRVDGLGPWIEQVPGVYGEVRAEYEYTTHE